MSESNTIEKEISTSERKEEQKKEDVECSLFMRTKHNKEMNITDFYKQKRHYFIMTDGGTPIYSRYGDQMENCGILATFSAIITKFTIFNTDANFAEKLNYISNDKSTVVFLKKGKIVFIALSKKKDSISFLYSQLEFLYSQLLSIVTSERIPRLEEKPSSCMNALQDTDQLFEQMIDSTSKTMVSLLSAYQVLPIENRNKLNDICWNYLGDALICCIFSSDATEMIAMAKTNLIILSQTDIILIQNLLLHSDSLRATESWVPICLPGIAADGYVQLYSNFTSNENLGVVFITENQDNNYFLKFCTQSRKMIDDIVEKGLINNIVKSLTVRKVDSIEEENKKDDNETIDDFVKKIFSNVSSSGKTSPNETENSQHNNIMSQSTVVQEQNLLGSGNKRGSMHTSSIAETNNTSANLVKEFDLNTSAMNRKYTFTNTVYKARDPKKDPLMKLKYAIFKHKILNQFFSVNFAHYNKIKKEEKYIYRVYGKLYDLYNSQDSSMINLNNFFHFEKDSNYAHVLFTNENYILMATFNLFKSSEEIFNICKDIFKIVRSYESNFFITIKQ